MRDVRRAGRWAVAMAVAVAAAGCGGAGGGPVDGPTPRPANARPGFDTSLYPGDAVMRAWRDASPYEWVGYYLPAPCHRDASWSGRRASLRAMGWGTAVLYVGQQAWAQTPADTAAADTMPRDTAAPPPPPPQCSRAFLTAARGRTEADDAIAKTAAEGFPAGSVIYLDVERMPSVPQEMVDYLQAWIGRVLEEGRFRPGIYAHHSNADALRAAAQVAYAARGRTGEPSWWIAKGAGFAMELPPTGSGFGYADVWQGILDVRETHGGHTLPVDINVAATADPSSPSAP